SAASSTSGGTATPSVRSAFVTSSCRRDAVVLLVRSLGGWFGRRAGVGGFAIVLPLVEQRLVVGGGSRGCRLPVEESVQVARMVVGQRVQRRLGPAARREDALHRLKA